MPRLLIAALAVLVSLVAASPSVAHAATPCWKRVINDWTADGQINGHYSPHCLRQAIKNTPEDLRDYSSIDDDINAAKQGWGPADRPGRLRLICDAYGLDLESRLEVLHLLGESIASGGEFVRQRAEAGEPGFVRMWAEIGGVERFDRRRRWWADQRQHFALALEP